MEEKIIGILKSVSELFVATLVDETETKITVKDAAFLGIGGQNGQVNINFIPIEMLSLNPPVNIRNLLADPTQDLTWTFDKGSLLKYDLTLSDNVLTNYKQLVNKSPIITPDKSIVRPDDNIVKLF
jgi:hypothetical protein